VILFACDLDNTLIHTQKRPGDICVERKDGEEHAFMSPGVYRGLEELEPGICFVPVTGKSAAQYRRIHYFTAHIPPYALASCGGVLFRGGERDPLWEEAFYPQIREASETMRRCLSQLLPRRDVSWAKWVDRVFIAAQSADPQGVASRLSQEAGSAAVEFFTEDSRLYIFPRGFNKGSAVNMLRLLVQPEILVCAGDSRLDLPMLRAADIALVPGESLARQLRDSPGFRGKLYCPERQTAGGASADFADYIIAFASGMLRGPP
jgi:hydroxymethylpyrimidine pyrophosphatase-like HAD family hydrolase